jgi:hypothetical protein
LPSGKALQLDSTAGTGQLRGPAFLVRTDRDPKLLLAAVQRAARTIDQQVPLVKLRPMSDEVDGSLESR